MAKIEKKPFILLAKKAKRRIYLADPQKLDKPPVTKHLAEAFQWKSRTSGLKHLRRHPRLKKIFRCTRAA
jgi:hypothetical protein